MLAGFFAFFTAFGIGANDVANAFATSVGSKALTIRKAMMIATVMEFGGAVLLGGQVSETIRKGISDPACFTQMPAVLMWGMCSVCLCVGIWLLIATYLELPVSTTHSAIGGVIGFTLVAVGSDCVVWNKTSDEFPYVKGVASVVVSWGFSPVFSGILSAALYFFVRRFILRSENSVERAFIFFPVLVAFTSGLCCFYIIIKGAKGVNSLWGFKAQDEDFWLTCVLAICAGILSGALSLLLRPTIRKVIDETSEDGETAEPVKSEQLATDMPDDGKQTGGALGWLQRILDTDTTAIVADDATTSAMHAQAEKFSPKAEVVFKYMQIMTAAFDSFAHGANDVANAMGPFTAVWFVYSNNGKYSKKNNIGPDIYWILALGGFGIVVGLGVYGYKIMFALGLKLAKVTPSRGFAIELGAMFIILIGSRYGIPLSTTHCQVGATIGVSLMEGKASSTNWVIVGKAVAGWIFTLIIAGTLTATVFSMGYAGINFDDSQVLSKGWQGF